MYKTKINQIRLAFFARILLILGGINYLYMGIFSHNKFLFMNIPKNIQNILFIIIGTAALYLFFNRDYYLPFLGESVIPTIVPLRANSKNIVKTVITNLPPKSTIIYWAAVPGQGGKDVISDPYTAYSNYTNSGVVLSNEKGEAELVYECPVKYQVSKFGIFKKNLNRHLHYRYMNPQMPGFISEVKTLFLNGNCKSN